MKKLTLHITVHYADEKTVEKYKCTDFPAINPDFTTLYLENFARKTIATKTIFKMDSNFK